MGIRSKSERLQYGREIVIERGGASLRLPEENRHTLRNNLLQRRVTGFSRQLHGGWRNATK